jgi:hypothetical protein
MPSKLLLTVDEAACSEGVLHGLVVDTFDRDKAWCSDLGPEAQAKMVYLIAYFGGLACYCSAHIEGIILYLIFAALLFLYFACGTMIVWAHL